MNISYQNKFFIVQFNYDPAIVRDIKRIPARMYIPKEKKWIIPQSSSLYIEKFIKLYPCAISDEARTAINEFKDRAASILVMKCPDYECSATMSGDLPLRNYQKVGVEFILQSHGGLLAYDVGTGKTLMGISIHEYLSSRNSLTKTLVIVPNTLKLSWKEEIEKWTPHRTVSVINGTPAQRAAQWEADANYYIVNYECLLKDEFPFNYEWSAVICDEATRIMNPSAKITKRMYKIKSGYRIAMSGTPVSNRPDDIWSILNWCFPGQFGTWFEFVERYAIRNNWNQIVSYHNMEEFASRISMFFMRKTKQEVLTELPEKIQSNIIVSLSDKEKEIYTSVKEMILKELLPHGRTSKIELASLGQAMVRMLRLKQVSDTPKLIGEYTGTESKIDAVLEKLTEIKESGEKAIIFTQFAELIPILQDRYNAMNPAIIKGELSIDERMEQINRFRNDSGCSVLISTEAGGEGLNLQVANHIIHFDLPWSIAKLVQRSGRAHRMGQKLVVNEWFVIAKGTIDEYIVKKLYKKQELSDQLLSPEDISEMLL